MIATAGFPMAEFGSPKFGWFVRLNDSARNCSLKRSEKLKSRMMLKSRSTKPGPRRISRPEFPKQIQVGTTNADVSNQCVRLRASDGTLPSAMRFGRAVVAVPEGSVLEVTVNGWPPCAEKMVEICQSLMKYEPKRRDLPKGS